MKIPQLVLLVIFGLTSVTYSQGNYDLAKIYPDDFQGNLTYSGEVYDFDKLTAAHPNLPLGTLIRVINPTNNKRVILRINDRISQFLPWKLFLSKSAGESLNITQTTPFDVAVEILKLGNLENQMTEKGINLDDLHMQKYHSEIKGNFAIQLGSFSNKKSAMDFIWDLEVKGFTQIHLKEPLPQPQQYHVIIGPFDQAGTARQTLLKLRSIFNLDGFVIPLN